MAMLDGIVETVSAKFGPGAEWLGRRADDYACKMLDALNLIADNTGGEDIVKQTIRVPFTTTGGAVTKNIHRIAPNTACFISSIAWESVDPAATSAPVVRFAVDATPDKWISGDLLYVESGVRKNAAPNAVIPLGSSGGHITIQTTENATTTPLSGYLLIEREEVKPRLRGTTGQVVVPLKAPGDAYINNGYDRHGPVEATIPGM